MVTSFDETLSQSARIIRQRVCLPQAHVFHLLLFLDAVSRVVTTSGALVFQRMNLFVFWERTVEMLLKDRFGFDGLELSLEVFGTFGVRGRVGATTRIVHVDITDVGDLIAWMAPIAFSTTILLSLLWVNVDVTVLAEEFGEHGFSWRSILAEDAVTEFVGASHDVIED